MSGTLTLLALVVLLAVVDPSAGLLAPVGGHGLPVVAGGAAFRWSGLAVGLPVLLAATALPILALTRAGRSGRVLVISGVVVGAAGAVSAAAAGFVTALPLVGAHLSLGAALHYAFVTCGFAGAKLLLVGPLVGAAAAIAHRTASSPAVAVPPPGAAAVGLPPARSDDEPRRARSVTSPSRHAALVMLVVACVSAVTLAASSWRGGPLGYAFTGPLVAPTVAAGPLGALAGLAVYLGVFVLAVRALSGRLGEPVAGRHVAAASWVAAAVGGLALGVVDALVAALGPSAHLADAGPDSWWIATSLLSLAAGLGYGVTVGLVGAAVAGPTWTWLSHRADAAVARASADRRRGLVAVGAAGVVALVTLPVVVAAPAPAAPPAPVVADTTGTLTRLQLVPAHTQGGLPTIGDAAGREVLLRGVDVNQLVDYYLRDLAVPANGALTDADFAQMASLGFDVVRLGMSWSRLEPARGQFDDAYLAQVRAAVDSAAAHGIYTVLDMHEDAWGNALAAPHQACTGGTSPTTGYDGAPSWATTTDGTLHCQFLARDLAPATATAFSNFYGDRDGIQTELVRTWAHVAHEFADEPAVAGYDLLNEPGIGATPPISSGLLLGRYYDAAITAIRAAESSGGGFSHLVFFEPSVLWSGLGFDAAPPPGFTHDRQLVFAPHPYSESITMDQSFGLTIASIERNLTVSSRAAAAYGAALWAGEWGWFGDPSVDGAKVQRFVAAQNRLRVGGAFWVWRQGCGAPETDADATSSGNFVKVDCATGELTQPPAGFAGPLSSAYPRATPGRLTAIEPTDAGLVVTGTVDGVGCGLDLWVPGSARPAVEASGAKDTVVQQVPGGWRVTGCLTGAYRLTITR
ncbi:glycoside hydrolase family 5 protein [Cellulomonas alba]|uniref:Cellulase family glycosylhydrolase n=1 Tax=Cellulomonas alba TaxID=3053467 RepID=A0ABT7SGA2_9CELL|nr:cellulase family glycosylhydrolase [Cellulomonas alba]MDM7855222.1 cellulase family glycosylhydrolase [Cellulomonas alba]